MRWCLSVRLLGVVACIVSLSVQGVWAQEKPKDYPTRQIELIVGAGAGGGTDIFARTIVLDARRTFRVPVVVLNIPAAGGAEAVAEVMRRPADGYTLMAINPVQIIAYVMKRSPYGPDAFEPIINCQRDVLTLLVKQNGQFNTLDDFLGFAKSNPNKITIGGTGAGSFDEVMVALFAKSAKINVKYIPFDSGSEMQSQLLGGHIHAIVDEPGPAAALLEANKLSPLLAFAESRLKPFPDVPTSVERGWDVTLGAWRGIAAKKGTSAGIVKYLHDVLRKSMQSAAYKAVEKASYLDLIPGYLSSEQFSTLMEKEQKIYGDVLKDLGYGK